jgi:hypothetical protein
MIDGVYKWHFGWSRVSAPESVSRRSCMALFIVSPSSFDKISQYMYLAASANAPASPRDRNNTYI